MVEIDVSAENLATTGKSTSAQALLFFLSKVHTYQLTLAVISHSNR